MRKAFTMIEVIFVIVIIGILAAVAIPKLTATRSDAKGIRIVYSLSTCINEAGNTYMRTSSFHHLTQDDNATVNCQNAKKCFTFTETDSNGSLKVENLQISDKICEEAQSIAARNLLAVTHTINF